MSKRSLKKQLEETKLKLKSTKEKLSAANEARYALDAQVQAFTDNPPVDDLSLQGERDDLQQAVNILRRGMTNDKLITLLASQEHPVRPGALKKIDPLLSAHHCVQPRLVLVIGESSFNTTIAVLDKNGYTKIGAVQHVGVAINVNSNPKVEMDIVDRPGELLGPMLTSLPFLKVTKIPIEVRDAQDDVADVTIRDVNGLADRQAAVKKDRSWTKDG